MSRQAKAPRAKPQHAPACALLLQRDCLSVGCVPRSGWHSCAARFRRGKLAFTRAHFCHPLPGSHPRASLSQHQGRILGLLFTGPGHHLRREATDMAQVATASSSRAGVPPWMSNKALPLRREQLRLGIAFRPPRHPCRAWIMDYTRCLTIGLELLDVEAMNCHVCIFEPRPLSGSLGSLRCSVSSRQG